MSFDPDDLGSNPSDNPDLQQVIAQRFSRRSLLQGGLGVAALGFLGGGSAALLTAGPASAQAAL